MVNYKIFLILLVGFIMAFLATSFSREMVSLRGTLVLMIPTKDGLVVAADSRSTILNNYCDATYKLLKPVDTKGIVLTVTGHGEFIAAPPMGNIDLCEYIKSAPRQFDVKEVAGKYLTDQKANIFKFSIDNLSRKCLSAANQYMQSTPQSFIPFIGREIFSVVIAGYDDKKKISIIYNFVIRLSTSSKLEIGRLEKIEINESNPRDVLAFGETDYLNANVYGGVGRQFLNERAISFLLEKATVGGTSAQDGIEIANLVIDATADTTKIIRAATGIGGPTDIVILNGAVEARLIQWK